MSKPIFYIDSLTNEQLNKRFKNQFDLVRYAIKLAENCVQTGHAPETEDESENLAFQVLAAIAEHKDHFEEIPTRHSEVSMQQEAQSKRNESSSRNREGKRESKRESSRQKVRS